MYFVSSMDKESLGESSLFFAGIHYEYFKKWITTSGILNRFKLWVESIITLVWEQFLEFINWKIEIKKQNKTERKRKLKIETYSKMSSQVD